MAAPLAEGHGSVAIAGISLGPSNATLGQVTAALAVGGAVFVIVAGFGAYWLARAALAPVERLRREVAALSERDTGSTVQVPGTHDEIAALAGTMNDLLVRLHGALARQRPSWRTRATSCARRSPCCGANSNWPGGPGGAGRNSARRWPARRRKPTG